MRTLLLVHNFLKGKLRKVSQKLRTRPFYEEFKIKEKDDEDEKNCTKSTELK